MLINVVYEGKNTNLKIMPLLFRALGIYPDSLLF